MRTILALMTGCALLSVLMGVAARGQMWAWGLVIGVASLGVTMLVHAAWFVMVSMFSRLETRRAGAAVVEERT